MWKLSLSSKSVSTSIASSSKPLGPKTGNPNDIIRLVASEPPISPTMAIPGFIVKNHRKEKIVKDKLISRRRAEIHF